MGRMPEKTWRAGNPSNVWIAYTLDTAFPICRLHYKCNEKADAYPLRTLCVQETGSNYTLAVGPICGIYRLER
jgi:hypothetical protein